MNSFVCDVKDCPRTAVHAFKGEFWTFRVCCECLHGDRPADERLLGEQCYRERTCAPSAASA